MVIRNDDFSHDAHKGPQSYQGITNDRCTRFMEHIDSRLHLRKVVDFIKFRSLLVCLHLLYILYVWKRTLIIVSKNYYDITFHDMIPLFM